MFTVCPKCALTLVVTAADLRVAQGYVRCGRCSNVFNALSRLSEDRQAAAAAAQSQPSPQPAPASPQPAPAPKAATPPQQRADGSGTFRTRDAAARKPAQPPPPSEPKRYDDDSIPEEDLEFNPDATDLNKVFVEQPPSPQFTAATGTFKAIRLEAEASAREADELSKTDERENPEEHFDPTDTQVDVEIDPDLIATMTQLTTKERVNSTPAEPVRPQAPAQRAAPPKPAPPQPVPAPSAPPQPATPRSAAPSKQSLMLQPPPEQATAPPPMRLAERAKARAAAARSGTDRTVETPRPDVKPKSDADEARARFDPQRASAFETSQAIRDALAPRRRSITDITSAHTEEPTSFFSGMWTMGSLALLALLLVQVVHHYRHDLATNPTLNGPLTSIYAVLGVSVVPRWDLNAYEVRQLGASAAPEAPGQITVRASVKNVAHQAQPLPLLRVTLQDRFGNRIASRDVPPQAYLPRAIPSTSLLSAGQRIDAEMTFVDPGANAVGFEIDACMPAPEGGMACANDAAR